MTRFQLPTLLLVPSLILTFTPAALAEAEEGSGRTAAEAPDGARDDAGEPGITVREELLVEDRAPYLPESVSTATKTRVPIDEVPASVAALSHSLLRDRNALILGDALTNVAGVNAQSNSGVHDLFFLRGFDSLSSSLVMTDGIAEPEATFYQLYNVERVEVMRGPAGFLYGNNAVAGAVNLVRKRPLGGFEGRAGVLFGSHSTLQSTVDVNYGPEEGRGRFRLNGLWRSSDGYRDDKASAVFALNPVFTFLAGERTALTFSGEVLRSDFEPDAGIPLLFGALPDVPRERSYQTPFDFSDQDLTRLRVDVESHLGPRLTLRNKTWVTTLDWQSKGTLITGAFPNFEGGGIDVFRTRSVLDDRQRFAGNQLEAVIDLEAGRATHQLVAGLELSRLRDELQLDVGLLPSIDLFDPVERAPERDFLLPGFGAAADARTTIVAPYLLDQIELGRWRLFVGGRFDRLDFEDDASGRSATESQLSPFAGALYAASDAVSLYANYSESFSAPSTLVAGQDREPEEGRQVEAGIKSSYLGGKLRSSVAVYRIEKDKIAIVDATGLTAQLGDQEAEGVELELSGSPRSGLNWTFSYAYTDAELVRFTEVDPFFGRILDFSGNVPAYTPEHLANLWVSHRFAGGFGVSGGARWVGDQFIDEDNAFVIDEYVTLDALVSYERPGWGARVHLRNLTDEEYEGRGFGSASVLPADGFNVMGGFHLNW